MCTPTLISQINISSFLCGSIAAVVKAQKPSCSKGNHDGQSRSGDGKVEVAHAAIRIQEDRHREEGRCAEAVHTYLEDSTEDCVGNASNPSGIQGTLHAYADTVEGRLSDAGEEGSQGAGTGQGFQVGVLTLQQTSHCYAELGEIHTDEGDEHHIVIAYSCKGGHNERKQG